jgi:hypothetical protein
MPLPAPVIIATFNAELIDPPLNACRRTPVFRDTDHCMRGRR